jgi:PKHD-type hydroxylase
MSSPTIMVNNELAEKMFFIPRFVVDNNTFSAGECDFISSHFQNNYLLTKGQEYTTYSGIPEQRRANIVLTNQPDEKTEWLWQKFNNLIAHYNDRYFNFDLYGFNYLQYAKYDVGDKHEFHMDLPLDGKHIDTLLLQHLRKITVVLLLNEPGVDFEGGDFQINHFSEQYPWSTNLKKGSVLLFPSFLLHRVAPILSGNRQSITIWAVGPKFK